MGRVAKSERTKSQLRAEARGIQRAKKVMARPAPKPTLRRTFNAPAPKLKRKPTGVLAPGAKFNRKTGKITPPKAPRSRVFDLGLKVKGPERFAKLSVPNPARVVQTKTGPELRKKGYVPGTVEFKQARRFSRSPMGELSRQLKKEEKRQSKLTKTPVRLRLNRQTGTVRRIVGEKAIAKDKAQQVAQVQIKRERRRAAERGDIGNQIVGAGREAGRAMAYVTARGQSFNPAEALAKIAGAEAAKKIVGKKKAQKIQTSGLPGLPNSLSKEIKVEKPENVLRLVEQTQRPIRGIASAEKRTIQNLKRGKTPYEGVVGAGVQGFRLKNNTYSSDVLKEIGIGGATAAGLGFALDVAQDPLTYVTFGAGGVGRVGVMQAAKAAEKRVYKKALSQLEKAGVEKKTAERQARTFGVRARRRVEAEADRQVAYARAHGKAKRAAKKAGKSEKEAADAAHAAGTKAARKLDAFRLEVGTKRRKAGINVARKKPKPVEGLNTGSKASKIRKAGRILASEVNPKINPTKGASRKALDSALAVNRRIRAVTNEGVGIGQLTAEAYAKLVKPEHYDEFINAIETGDKSNLPKYLTEPSVTMKVQKSSSKSYRDAFSGARKAGATKAEAKKVAEEAAAAAPSERRKVSIYDATQAMLRNERKQRLRAGLKVGEVRRYFPHMVDTALRSKRPDVTKAEQASEEAQQFVARKVPRRAPNVGSAMGRSIKATRREANDILRAAGKDEFSADLPLVLGNYRLQTSRAKAQQQFNKGMESMGREVQVKAESKPIVRLDAEGNVAESKQTVRKSVDPEQMKRGGHEKVYVQVVERRNVSDGSKARKGPAQAVVREANPGELRRIDAGNVPREVRRVFVADEGAVKRAEAAFNQYSTVPRKFEEAVANKSSAGILAYGFLDKIYDPFHRAWKNVAVRTPQFHMRNMIGDISMAYNHVPGYQIPSLLHQSMRITKHLRGARGNVLGVGGKDTKIWIGNKVHGELMEMDDFANEMIENGVILGGVLGNDLESLSKFGARGVVQKNGRIRSMGRSFDRTLQDRENLMRMAVYKHFRDEGLDPDAAARKVADALIDYGELTTTEKEVFKRMAPFYVFAARSIPMYAMTLLMRPGKLANLEKLRQEAGKAQGIEADSLKNEAAFIQRGFAFPLRIGGKTYFPSAGLPLFALNMLPAGLSKGDLEKVISENFRYWASSLGPLPGGFAESVTGKSFFYNKTLEPDYKGKRVASRLPQWFLKSLGKVPVVNEKLDIGPYFDKRTGKIVTGWRGKAENVTGKLTPGAVGFGLSLSQDVTPRGQGRGERVASFFSGVKLDPSNPQARRDEVAFKKWADLKKRMDTLNQEGDTQPVKKKKELVGKQMAELERYLYQSTKAQGYKKPLFANRAPKDPFALPALPELPKLPTLGQ